MRGGAGEVRRRAPPPVNIIGASASPPLIQRAHAAHAAPPPTSEEHAASPEHTARNRVFINEIPRALFTAGYNFLHDFQHLRRTEH